MPPLRDPPTNTRLALSTAPTTVAAPPARPRLRRRRISSSTIALVSFVLHAIAFAVAGLLLVPQVKDTPLVAHTAAPIAAEQLDATPPPPPEKWRDPERADDAPPPAEEPLDLSDDPALELECDAPAPRAALALSNPFGRNGRLPRRIGRGERDATGDGASPGRAPATEAPAPPPTAAPAPKITAPLPHESNEAPRYPRRAERRRLAGVVVLAIHVSASGEVTRVEIETSSGHDMLDEAARDAALEWTFEPALRGADPIARVVRQRIRFAAP